MTNIANIKELIKSNKDTFIGKRTELDFIKKEIKTKEEEKEKLEKENYELIVMKQLIDKSCAEARENGIRLFSDIATTSVQSVFGENMKVILQQSIKDGTPNIDVMIEQKVDAGVIQIDPTDNDGGGLADIVAQSLFMAFGQMLENNNAPYVLDEPTKYVSKGNFAEKSAEFIKNMVSLTQKQTILSTHDTALANVCDTLYRMEKDEKTGITSTYKEK